MKITDEEKSNLFSGLINKINKVTREHEDADEVLQKVCDILKREVSYYDWVGFYLTDPNAERELILGPYSGAPTEHVRIGFGQGICGQAAETRKTLIVPDVAAETNYLSCSPTVKSEIVLPILRQGEVLGELDIDSHTIDPFTDEDRGFLLKVCYAVARFLHGAQEARRNP